MRPFKPSTSLLSSFVGLRHWRTCTLVRSRASAVFAGGRPTAVSRYGRRSRASSRYTGWQAGWLTLVRTAAAWLFVAPRQCVAGGNAFVRSRATAGCPFVALSAGIDHDRATHTWTVNAASKGRIRFVMVSLSLAIHLPWPLGFSSPQPRLRARRFNFSVSVVTIRCAQHLYRPHWPGKRHPQ